MKLLRFLVSASPGMMCVVVLSAGLCGALNAGLIAVVNRALHAAPDVDRGLALAFVALAVGRLGTHWGSQLMLAGFAQTVVARMRRQMVDRILSVPLSHLERLGAHRLMASITTDVSHVTTGLMGIPSVAVNVALLLGGAAYIGWLSWRLLAAMLLMVALGAVVHRLILRGGIVRLRQSREEHDALFSHFRSLTEGVKELKLHRNRREDFLTDCVDRVTNACREHALAAETRFIGAKSTATMLFYALIGMLLFTLPSVLPTTPERLTGCVLTCLYLMGPLNAVMGSYSFLARAGISLEKVQSLGIEMEGLATERRPIGHRPDPTGFERVELRRVVHKYRGEREDESFTLGPVDLVLRSGEVVFLVGGNGSGKSTLAKIITGLYPPEHGEIVLDGRVVDDDWRDDYRQLFSAVFTDFHLFDSLLGIEAADLDDRAREYLRRLHLDDKLSVDEGRLSTVSLSQGQRKRLALLVAWMEDRPFYVFDEWAADQDPQFKAVFYTRLLPELKTRGKTVLVITHDDRWFHLADRLVKLDSGQVAPQEGGCHSRAVAWRGDTYPSVAS